jgi:hypothetical protein
VTSVIPAAGEVAPAGLAKLTVVFARDVDASLVSSTFEVRDGFDQPVPWPRRRCRRAVPTSSS